MSGGIRTIADLKDRCTVDEDTRCWVWKGATSDGSPSMWIAGLQTRARLSLAIHYLKTGERLPKGMHWACRCKTPNCANPAHRDYVSTSELWRRIAAPRPLEVRLRIGVSKRLEGKSGRKYSDEVIQQVRAATGTTREVGKQFNMSESYVSQLRRGMWRAPKQPAAGSSVFTFGAARA